MDTRNRPISAARSALAILLTTSLAASCAAPPEGEAEAPASGEAEDTSEPSVIDEPRDPEGLLSFSGEVPRNVLMISIDTLRRDRVGAYSGLDTSPTLDRLLAEGVALDDHRSCSNWTYDSVVCVQAAAPTFMLGVSARFAKDVLPALPEDTLLVSDSLLAQGFQTGLVTTNGMLGDELNTATGFESVVFENDGSPPEVNAQALALLDGFDPDRPWYLHAHYTTPHAPYDPPMSYRDALQDLEPFPWELDTHSGLARLDDEYRELSDEARALAMAHIDTLYQAEIRYTDDGIGDLLDAVEARGALEDTLVVVWSDHGEQFYEHGDRGHGQSLHDEENMAIALFWAEGLPARDWTRPTSHTDIWPTALAALGLAPLPRDRTGIPLGRRRADTPRFAHKILQTHPIQMIALDQHKLVYDWRGTHDLYDLTADPDELYASRDRDDPDAQALWALLERQVTALGAVYEDAEPNDPGL